MQIGAVVCQPQRVSQALPPLIEQARAPLGGKPAHLGFLFASNHFEEELESIVAKVRQQTGVINLVGCTGEGVCGPGSEVERLPALALWLGYLPGAKLHTFHLAQDELEQVQDVAGLHELMGVTPTPNQAFVIVGDPYSFHIVNFLEKVDESFPGAPVVGGMASGADAAGQTRLVWDDQVFNEGTVGVALSGNVRVEPIVSQGCRPVGRPFVITAAEQNVIKLLGGKPAWAMLHEVFEQADVEEKKLMQQGVFLGQVIDEYKGRFSRGDFLIRNMLGGDQQSGALVIGDFARVGRTIQFHVRDAKTADEDLRSLLSASQAPRPAGALLFTCNGRGTRLFSQPGHDVNAIGEVLGDVPVAGFFAAGELGPIGNRNFIHGHTASLALFRPAPEEGSE